MPIYEFRCRDCGCITETLVFTTAPGVSCRCKNCGGAMMERIMSRPASCSGDRSGLDRGTCAGQWNGVGNWPQNDDYIRLKGQQ